MLRGQPHDGFPVNKGERLVHHQEGLGRRTFADFREHPFQLLRPAGISTHQRQT
jgi:hypothetical protein